MNIAVITTFPNAAWEVYAKRMVSSFAQYWPKEIPLMIELDDDLLKADVNKLLRPQDAIADGWMKEHRDFVEAHKDKDDPQNYRKQAVRFSHKVFAIVRALIAAQEQKKHNEFSPRYLIWMDADVITEKPVTLEDIKACLPKEGDAVAYMGRKDWDHSECGWLAFDLESGGDIVIANAFNVYKSGALFNLEQWHDSWVFDRLREQLKDHQAGNWTNLTLNANGMDVWKQSPMGKWSTHYKGPQAKAKMVQEQRPIKQNIPLGKSGNVVIQTRNAIPHEEIRAHIRENQVLIKNWIVPCTPNEETLVMVSAGTMLIPEDLHAEIARGRRIVAVKHALEPLKMAGIKPWACILLDPRPHVHDFVKKPDKDILWFVASQVDPLVVRTLRDAGCTIWGYHAAVGAEEQELTKEQPFSVISGGTATATRGLHVMNHLGFSKFHLYGYDLCLFDKPDLTEKDKDGQPKYMEISIGFNDKHIDAKRCFWTKPEFIAQFEELNELIRAETFEINAFGDGIVPFIIRSKRLANLRNQRFAAKLGRLSSYRELLKCPTWRTSWRKWWPKIHRKPMPDSRYCSY